MIHHALRKAANGDDGFTLMETIVALVIFSAAILLFERSVAGAWRGINAANMNTGAVQLAEQLLDEASPASAQDAEGRTGRYDWRRQTVPVDSGADPGGGRPDDVVTFWVEVNVAWRDGLSRSPHVVRYRLLKAGRRPA